MSSNARLVSGTEQTQEIRAGAAEALRKRAAFSHDHANVLGVEVSAINLETAVQMSELFLTTGLRAYICVTGVHGVMEAQRDPGLRTIMNAALINAPDGMPMSWVGRLQGKRDMDRVFGPDYMSAMCALSIKRGYRHFLYGGEAGVAELLQRSLEARYPGIHIVGICTPSFHELTPDEEESLFRQVRETRPDIVWVGLSTPKQERFMARYSQRLQVPLMAGVGAAFDFHTGRVRDCSKWIKRAGLQWLHRMLQDPKRLWRRYLRNNPAFIWKITLQLTGVRRYPRFNAVADAPDTL